MISAAEAAILSHIGQVGGSSGRHLDLEPVRLLKAISIARSKAGCARFLTLIHSRQRPER
jgi:hypothetical protein